MDQMSLELRSQQNETAPDWRDDKPDVAIVDEGAMLQRKLAFQEALVAFSMWEKEIRHLETILLIAQPSGEMRGPHERIHELKSLFVNRYEALFLSCHAVMKLPSRKIFESYRKFKNSLA
jgi:hypothetical protein